MNLHENIQAHRKRLQISQEELGKMLFVSRQTISMWEKGQTVPTIDNLVRLAEIFSVSIDELLKGDVEIATDEAKESYAFQYSAVELKEIHSYQNALVYKQPLIFVFVAVFLLFFLISSESPDILSGFAFGALLTGTISYVKGIIAYKKARKNGFEKITETTYHYKIFDDYLKIEIFRSGKKTRSQYVRHHDIEKVQQLKNHYLLQIAGQLFIVRKSDLKENSAFYSYLYHNPAKIMQQQMPNRWKITSTVLFVLSFCSIWFALLSATYVSGGYGLYPENMWTFFSVTPIPVSSIVFGFLAKKKGYECKKNIVGGMIMTVLLCIFGSFVFIF